MKKPKLIIDTIYDYFYVIDQNNDSKSAEEIKEAYELMIDALIYAKSQLELLEKETNWFNDDLNEMIEKALLKAGCHE